MKDLNDYELVYLAQEGNEEAINLLYQKYRPIIIKKSKIAITRATHHGIEINDIMQEGFIALDEAIKSFSQDNDASFYTFALVCIDRQILNYLRKITGCRGKSLNDAVAIDDGLEKIISDNTNIELSVMMRDELNSLIDKINPLLTNFEKRVFEMLLNDNSFDEIAKILNKDIKSVYNAFNRIKFKIKKNIKIDD